MFIPPFQKSDREYCLLKIEEVKTQIELIESLPVLTAGVAYSAIELLKEELEMWIGVLTNELKNK